jgi:hypothetical protein
LQRIVIGVDLSLDVVTHCYGLTKKGYIVHTRKKPHHFRCVFIETKFAALDRGKPHGSPDSELETHNNKLCTTPGTVQGVVEHET